MRVHFTQLALIIGAQALLWSSTYALTEDGFNNQSNLTILEKWRIIQQSLNKTASSLVKYALPLLVRSTEEIDVTEDCRTGILQILNGAKALKSWAFKFLDSFGKPPGGLLTGTLSAFGAYDQCLAINVPEEDNPSKSMFQGKYCTLELRPPLPPKPAYYNTHHKFKAFENFTEKDSVISMFQEHAQIFYVLAIRIGLCVPSTCTLEDIRGIGTVVGEMMHFETRVPHCEVSESTKLSVPQIVVICIIGLWMVIIFSFTVADVIYSNFFELEIEKKKSKGKLSQFLSSLSLYSGLPKALSIESAVDVKIFHGIRFLSVIWIILGNLYLFLNYQALQQLAEAQTYSQVFIFQSLFNSALAVDTLFFVSAFMTGYVIRNKQKDTKWMCTKVILHKFWRWTPVMMFMVGLAVLQPLATRGPLAKETFDPLYHSCINNWWANLFFINNLVVRYENRCLPNSWFLSCEIQMFLIGMLFLKMWNSSKKVLAMILTILSCLVSILVTGIITAYFQFPPAVLFSQTDRVARSAFEDAIHHKPYPHFTTWMIGLSLGYYLATRSKVTLSWYFWLSGWCAWLVSTNAVVFGIYEWNSYDKKDFGVAALYSSSHRGVWALALAWLTFCCFNGKVKIIQTVLSWNAWVPLSRLTMWAYLVHSVLQQTVEGHLRERLQSTSFMSVLLFCGFLLVTYIFSLILYLAVELPWVQLEKFVVEWSMSFSMGARKPSVAATSSSGHVQTVVNRVITMKSNRESQQSLAPEEVFSQLEYDNNV